MTIHAETQQWLQEIIPGNGVVARLDRFAAGAYHESALHFQDQIIEAEQLHSPILRRNAYVLRTLATIMVICRPGLKEYLDEEHATHPRQHRFDR